MSQVYGTTVFCDDLRQEIGGKISLIGCYSADMIIDHDFPVNIRLAMLTRIFIPTDTYVGKELRVAILFPGSKEPVSEMRLTIPESPKQDAMPRPDDVDPTAPKVALVGLNSMMPNVVIAQPGFIRVRAYIGDETVRCGALHVRKPSTPEELAAFQQLQPQT